MAALNKATSLTLCAESNSIIFLIWWMSVLTLSPAALYFNFGCDSHISKLSSIGSWLHYPSEQNSLTT